MRAPESGIETQRFFKGLTCRFELILEVPDEAESLIQLRIGMGLDHARVNGFGFGEVSGTFGGTRRTQTLLEIRLRRGQQGIREESCKQDNTDQKISLSPNWIWR